MRNGLKNMVTECSFFFLYLEVCETLSADQAATAREDIAASTRVCVLVAGVVLTQYIFTLKRNMRQKKPQITEMAVSKPCVSGRCVLSMLF